MDNAKKFLREKVNYVNGHARIAIKIALAKLGDTTYKQDVKKFLENEKMYLLSKMHLYALRTFVKIETSDDLAFMENLSNNDPVEVVVFKGKLYELVNSEFIHEKDKLVPISHPNWPQCPESTVKVNCHPRPVRYFLIRSEVKKFLQGLQ